MFNKYYQTWLKKFVLSKKKHTTYIVPTADGLKLLSLNILLLIIGLVYANNYVLLLNFILFCLFLGSMFYTHFNLQSLTLKSVLPEFIFAKEANKFRIVFSSHHPQGNYSIAVSVHFQSGNIASGKPEDITKCTKAFTVDYFPNLRGRDYIQFVSVATKFPFGLFNALTYFLHQEEIIIFPHKENLNLFKEVDLRDAMADDEFEIQLKNYQIGDSPKRIDWKKLAQTNQWYTKSISGLQDLGKMLYVDDLGKNDIEKEKILSSLSQALFQNYNLQISTGLHIAQPQIIIPPAQDLNHFKNCLETISTL